jgi:single-stranded-DNA-specific exonuclease
MQQSATVSVSPSMRSRPMHWQISAPRAELCRELSSSLKISPIISQVLVNRGVETPDQAGVFLSSRLQDLHDPFLMKDMERAVARVLQALGRREKICVYGDYDVDGITATAVLYHFLGSVGAQVQFYIPSRVREGYGLKREVVERLRHTGVSLILTVDCGVSDVAAVAGARKAGVDVVVTDHHTTPELLAPACALINPKQPGCAFPFKGLAGVGVAFNVVMALRKALREEGFFAGHPEPNLRQYLDLVALGTIADVVPMIDANRIFVKSGLEIMTRQPRPGIRALKAVSGLTDGAVTSTMVAYRLAPRLNAPGRLSDASQSVRLLLCDDDAAATELARSIDEENTRRQQVERRILADARTKLAAQATLPDGIVLASPAWHPGVVGLCASRLSEELLRPTVLVAVDEARGEGRGSARSIAGIDVYEAVKSCQSMLLAFGGHRGAAGLTVPVDNIAEFSAAFADSVRSVVSAGEYTPTLAIDAEIALGHLSSGVMDELETLAPFGQANPEPVFSSRDLLYYSAMVVGNGHLKLKIKEEGRFFDAIGFNMAGRYTTNDEAIRLAFVPQFNVYNGEKMIQLNLRDIKISPPQSP